MPRLTCIVAARFAQSEGQQSQLLMRGSDSE
jgi:hypothetical protein